ncbi:DUF4901 domain-containing protein [Paenibacillus macerans]|uniref:DUF4901 domain-containing protein n=1 Tax=Paenibacillus macerans TaxID=44252 RepID=A0A6N8F0G0_PAEMA|nr:YcdB/YcdC domain-containing protein [Paenibacillus macerans]MBS5914838.1 DUF4901 domain-containing protein [Paenibacillus macerans]MUG24091.1 DUF4901 domain-containing protein [Paenibacillus macerans]UMV45471.1 DUF4901 domain-containing protein [Paenibacillus macerans]
MGIDFNQLRQIAQTIAAVPPHYRLEMEDSVPQEEERERCFIWEDPGDEEQQIEVSLDIATGVLTRLSINGPEGDNGAETASLLADEDKLKLAKKAADAFVAEYHPEPGKLTFCETMKRRIPYTFAYRQEALGLPLPETGCELTVDHRFNVTRYRLEGRLDKTIPIPGRPEAIAPEAQVLEDHKQRLRMNPIILNLHPSIYEIKGSESEYLLVYEPEPDHALIDAATGRDLFGPDHYVLPPSRPLSSSENIMQAPPLSEESWEQRLGIDMNRYVLEKCSDDEERITRIYQLKTQEEEEVERDPLSAEGYMERKWGDKLRFFRKASIMVQVEKSTGRLVGYHHTGCGEEGSPALNRAECWEVAERFLRKVFPDYTKYLQLQMDAEDEREEERSREFFYLPVYIGGIPLHLERVTISVCTATKAVCMYMGTSYEMIEALASRQFHPAITPEQAFGLYAGQLKLRLKWFLDRDQETPEYRLVYQSDPTAANRRGEKRRLAFIDAVTGEFILRRE